MATISRKFCKLIVTAKAKAQSDKGAGARGTNSAIRQVVKRTHTVDVKYRIPNTFQEEEIKLIRRILRDKKIKMATRIGRVVPCKEDFKEGADLSKRAGGG